MSTNNTSGGIGFMGMLAIVFIALKLVGAIGWSWWWVLSPLWLPTALFIMVLMIAGSAYHGNALKKEKN